MKTKNDILVKKYLQEHSPFESNITSFNNFLNHRMQKIVDEINAGLNNDEVEIRLGKVRVAEPNIIEADGSSTIVTPSIARLRNLTYSAPVFVELSVKYESQSDSAEVEVGRIPIIVRSAACATN